jgi:hypothetical protein
MQLTEKSYIKLSKYTVYHMNHPAKTPRGGTTIIITNSIEYHQLQTKVKNSFKQLVCWWKAQSLSHFGCLSSTQIHSTARAIKRFLKYHRRSVHYRNTTMLSIPTGDPDSLHPEDVKYSKKWKETN